MRVNFVCWLIKCLFHPHVTAVARKRPRSFCQKCRWQVTPKHTYTFDPSKSEWADCAAVQAEYGNLSGNELTCSSSGNTRLVIFAGWATVDWTWPKEWNYFARAKLHVKKRKRRKKKCRRGLNCRTFSQNPGVRGKSHHHQTVVIYVCTGQGGCVWMQDSFLSL